MHTWVVKCRQNRADGTTGWHWSSYFESRGNQNFHFGGGTWIRSATSKKAIREEVRNGDIVLCYQKEGSSIVGMTRMASDGMEDQANSGDFNLFYLSPPQTAFAITPPVKTRELQTRGWNPACFRPGPQGTIFSISQAEWSRFLEVLMRLRPELALPAWARARRRSNAVALSPVRSFNPEEARGLTAVSDTEGEPRVRQHITYERSPRNRAMALRIHGTQCSACGFDFDDFYGQALAGSFIEIHHVQPVARKKRRVNPAQDLVPLCSNCHSIVHRNADRPLEVSALKKLLKKRGKRNGLE